jgi:SOS-response transcriptional repressor LexA
MNQTEGRKQAIYNFIDGFTKENHYPPTIREIGNAIGVH